MTDTHDVIAAFVDGERVASDALKRALADETGRDYLIDLVALREVVDAGAIVSLPAAAPASRRRWWLTAAALVMISVAGGYAIGRRSGEAVGAQTVAATSEKPPAPDRVITLEWQQTAGGH